MTQSLASVHVHIIFGTKGRKSFFSNEDLRSQLHSYIASILKAYDTAPVIIGGVQDHVHILCLLSKNHPLSKIVGEVKRNSSKWIKTMGAEYRDFSWQAGYGAFSVSRSKVNTVIKYIKGQKEHHKRFDFRKELIELLEKHGIEYDERRLLD